MGTQVRHVRQVCQVCHVRQVRAVRQVRQVRARCARCARCTRPRPCEVPGVMRRHWWVVLLVGVLVVALGALGAILQRHLGQSCRGFLGQAL